MSTVESKPTIPNEAAWNGLKDEQGPIPRFAPRRVDELGRLVPIGVEEREARAVALARTIRAIQTRPDRDPPGTDEDFMRAIDAERPHRPLFEGMY